ncbi:LysR family transcriptional regulator [Janthinobacterium sp. B9-8]|uniref:LysR family transcriptional regulator n=1 Tax=Janthinobacterium sp. B9-8 TaxID=1236179 RepID=UPI00061CE359|nr:LysR family transcriptional regulator [Janthinobacterium sp. B9-8]AMC36164.1 LysR family transcriptional regulator [Janthinobacterium sp. B9-8]
MDRLTAMRVFIEVVDQGSLTAAADKLDMPRAMVSRYLAELEAWLGVRLLHRSTRSLGLSSAGQDALPRCRQMLELADDVQGITHNLNAAPHGLIRVASSNSFAQSHLAAAAAAFVAQYPDTQVELIVGDRSINLVDERIDLAIRITNDVDPGLIARKLSVCRSVVCATPAYLAQHGTPLHPEDLLQHQCLTHAFFGKNGWRFTKEGQPFVANVAGAISANDANVILQAALAGAGVAHQPTFSAAPYLESGQLVRLLSDYQSDELGIYGLYTSRRHMPIILRSLLDFLADRFGREPSWDKVLK